MPWRQCELVHISKVRSHRREAVGDQKFSFGSSRDIGVARMNIASGSLEEVLSMNCAFPLLAEIRTLTRAQARASLCIKDPNCL